MTAIKLRYLMRFFIIMSLQPFIQVAINKKCLLTVRNLCNKPPTATNYIP